MTERISGKSIRRFHIYTGLQETCDGVLWASMESALDPRGAYVNYQDHVREVARVRDERPLPGEFNRTISELEEHLLRVVEERDEARRKVTSWRKDNSAAFGKALRKANKDLRKAWKKKVRKASYDSYREGFEDGQDVHGMHCSWAEMWPQSEARRCSGAEEDPSGTGIL